jgi:serine/threonine-protein kinase PknK
VIVRRVLVAAVTSWLLVAAGACTADRVEPVDGGAGDVGDVGGGVARDREPEPTPVPEARTEVGAARLGDDALVVVGGFRADGSAADRVDVYDLTTGAWTSGPPLPAPRHHPGAAAFRGRVFVAGGFSTAGNETDTVWSLGPDEDRWREEPPLGTARGALGLAGTGGRLVAFGGTSSGQVVATAEVLVAGNERWRPLPSLRQPREHTAAASADGRVYAIAGRVGSLESNLVSVESIDPAAFAPEWRKEPDLRHSRGGTAAAAVGDTVCVAGGEEPTGTIPSVECLVDGAWRDSATLDEPRHGLGVVAGRGRDLHALAGGPQPGLFVSTRHEVLAIPR